jgi:hypothetical protein
MTGATPDHIGQILAQWRRERPDLDVAPMGLLGRLFRVVQLADATLTESLADRYGLQPAGSTCSRPCGGRGRRTS